MSAAKLLRTSWLRVYTWRPEWEPRWKLWLFTDGPSPSRVSVFYPACWLCGRDYHKKWIVRVETPRLVVEVSFGYAHGR